MSERENPQPFLPLQASIDVCFLFNSNLPVLLSSSADNGLMVRNRFFDQSLCNSIASDRVQRVPVWNRRIRDAGHNSNPYNKK
jgi:hypothetical protein